MTNLHAKKGPLSTTHRSKSRLHASREATAEDVVQSLIDLFEHLGIDASHSMSKNHPITKKARGSSFEIPPDSLYKHTSAISELLTTWHQNPAYIDTLGNPLPIKLHGPRPSFRHLARQAQIELDESYLVAELERLGAVSIDRRNLISVHMRSFPVYEDKRLAVEHTLATLNGFIKTLRHNLISAPANSDQLFHRIACNRDFDNREIPALKIKVKRNGQSFLESFDNWLTRKALSKPRNRKSRAKRSKVSIGVYLSVEPR